MAANVRVANGARWRRLRTRVLREETTCHLCIQTVDVTLPHGLPGSPELDHIDVVSRGGDIYARTNLRLAHRWCNNQRKAKSHTLVRLQLAADPPQFHPDGTLARPGGRTPTRRLEPVTSRDW